MIKIIKGKDYKKYFNVYKDSNGKPYVVTSNKHISISHFGNNTLIITSNKAIGVDIQKITKVDVCLYSYLNIKKKSKLYFFREWTRREAMIKKNNLKLSDIFGLKLNGKFKTFYIYPYVISICK